MDRLLTQCPQCATLFKVSANQLQLGQGQVRCGSCMHVFNGADAIIQSGTHSNAESDAQQSVANKTDLSATTDRSNDESHRQDSDKTSQEMHSNKVSELEALDKELDAIFDENDLDDFGLDDADLDSDEVLESQLSEAEAKLLNTPLDQLNDFAAEASDILDIDDFDLEDDLDDFDLDASLGLDSLFAESTPSPEAKGSSNIHESKQQDYLDADTDLSVLEQEKLDDNQAVNNVLNFDELKQKRIAEKELTPEESDENNQDSDAQSSTLNEAKKTFSIDQFMVPDTKEANTIEQPSIEQPSVDADSTSQNNSKSDALEELENVINTPESTFDIDSSFTESKEQIASSTNQSNQIDSIDLEDTAIEDTAIEDTAIDDSVLDDSVLDDIDLDESALSESSLDELDIADLDIDEIDLDSLDLEPTDIDSTDLADAHLFDNSDDLLDSTDPQAEKIQATDSFAEADSTLENNELDSLDLDSHDIESISLDIEETPLSIAAAAPDNHLELNLDNELIDEAFDTEQPIIESVDASAEDITAQEEDVYEVDDQEAEIIADFIAAQSELDLEQSVVDAIEVADKPDESDEFSVDDTVDDFLDNPLLVDGSEVETQTLFDQYNDEIESISITSEQKILADLNPQPIEESGDESVLDNVNELSDVEEGRLPWQQQKKQSDPTLEAVLKKNELSYDALAIADIKINLDQVDEDEDDLQIPEDRHEPSFESTFDINEQLIEVEDYSNLKRFLWFMGSIILVFTLLLQYIWFYRAELQYDPFWQPLVEEVCQTLPCQLAPKRELSKLKISHRLVKPIGDSEKQMSVDLMLVNNATFEQPYPTIVVEFSDHNGAILSTERILPAQYLSAKRQMSLMPKAVDIHVHFEMLKPANLANGYTFKFE